LKKGEINPTKANTNPQKRKRSRILQSVSKFYIFTLNQSQRNWLNQKKTFDVAKGVMTAATKTTTKIKTTTKR